MFLSQSVCCSRILQQFGMEITKTVSTLMVDNIKEFSLELMWSEAKLKGRKYFPYTPWLHACSI